MFNRLFVMLVIALVSSSAFPQDQQVVRGQVSLSKDEVIAAKKLVLAPGAEIVTNGYNLLLKAQEITIGEGAAVRAFDSPAAVNSDGRDAGTLVLRASRISGSQLSVDLTGQKGGIRSIPDYREYSSSSAAVQVVCPPTGPTAGGDGGVATVDVSEGGSKVVVAVQGGQEGEMPTLQRNVQAGCPSQVAGDDNNSVLANGQSSTAGKPGHLVNSDGYLTISITNRNAAPGLAESLIQLSQLARSETFAALRRSGQADTNCESIARSDISGRTFDLARCAAIWPPRTEAPEIRKFEKAFAGDVKLKGIDAFPAVRVTSFRYQQRLTLSEITNRSANQVYRADAQGVYQITEKYRKFLCNPNVTFIPEAECAVRVSPQLPGAAPVFYVSQTGYKIRALTKMPRISVAQIAERLQGPVENAIFGRTPPPHGSIALLVNITRTESNAVSEVSAPVTVSQTNPARTASELWKSTGTAPTDVELAEKDNSPAFLLFDQIKDDRSMQLEDWVNTFETGLRSATSSGCKFGPAIDWHVDGAASVLFPRTGEALFSQGASATGGVSPGTVKGFILTDRHFIGDSEFDDGQKWWSSQNYGDGHPVVGVVVFSDPFADEEAIDMDSALHMLDSSESRLLVMSAHQSRDGSPPTQYDSQPWYVTGSYNYKRDCDKKYWPSCLGRNSRVLVVAPSDISTDAPGKAALLSPELVALGGSTVKIAAPGKSIPVWSPCASQPVAVNGTAATPNSNQSSSGFHNEDGSSFAAPMVALVLARMMEIGPERYSQYAAAPVWRLLATADPFVGSDGSINRSDVAFGELNAGRALRGITDEQTGPEGRATVYFRSNGADGNPKIQSAVVLPYPWTDADKNVEPQGNPVQYGLDKYERGVLAYQTVTANGDFHNERALDFRDVLRIKRSTSVGPHGELLFDIYYLKSNDAGTERFVDVYPAVRLGVGSQVAFPGFCTEDGRTSGPLSGDASGQARPACLYMWDTTSQAGFVPIDLNEIEEVVAPPAHLWAHFVKGIRPKEIAGITGKDSPWRAEYCKVGPRPKMIPVLLKLGQPTRKTCQ